MRLFCVEVFPAFFNEHLRLSQAVENLAVQELVAEPCFEAFAVSVLPWDDRPRTANCELQPVQPVTHQRMEHVGAFPGERMTGGVQHSQRCPRKPVHKVHAIQVATYAVLSTDDDQAWRLDGCCLFVLREAEIECAYDKSILFRVEQGASRSNDLSSLLDNVSALDD